MLELRQTETFRRWRSRLKDERARALIASRLDLPVVPVRLDGLDRVLHPSWHFVRPGQARVAFGAPLRLRGDDYAALARRVEEAVRAL